MTVEVAESRIAAAHKNIWASLRHGANVLEQPAIVCKTLSRDS